MTDQAITSPAAAPVAPAAAPAEAPQTAAAPEQASAQPAAQSPEPNWDAYLSDEATRRRLLEHPTLKKELEHRVKSTREADVEARVSARLAEREAQRQAEAEAARIQQMDSYELGELTKAQKAEQAQRQRLLGEVGPQAYQQAYQKAMAGIARAWSKEGLSDQAAMDVLAKVDRTSPTAAEDAIEALNDYLAEHRAEKRLKDRLPKEMEAKWEGFLAAKRDKEESPPTLPQSGAGARIYSAREIERMSLSEYRKHADDIDAATREGRIKP